MLSIRVVITALVYIGLLIVMATSLVGIMNNDVKFTDETGFTWNAGAAKRAAVKGLVCFVAFVVYLVVIINFKFLES